jgi:hypothetical protein
MIITLVVLSLLGQQGYYSESEAQSLFTQANEAQSRDDVEAARAGYHSLIDHGYGGPDVLYNLGTSHLLGGELGPAVLYLERARRAGGEGSDLQANLELARSRQIDHVVGGELEEPFLSRVVASTRGDEIAWAFVGCWTLAFALVILFRFLTPGRRTWAAITAGLLFVAVLPLGALLALHAWHHANVREAVVIAKTLPARELPSSGARSAFEVHEGLKVRVLEDSGGYFRIRLPNGLEGWAEKAGVTPI